ncbi:MAG: hypothetical protein JST11_29340 [Acidobacteria bacterium]|nr:hypothetical protein [Acidobacteriota bacterium]
MPLLKPTLPAGIAEAFSKALPAFLSAPRETSISEKYVGEAPSLPTADDLDSRAILHAEAQEIFVLALTDAANAADIGKAVPAGWRLLAGDSAGKAVLGRVSRRGRPERWKLTATHYGGRVWQARQASSALDALREVREADYELRVLAVPGLNLEVFWLVARTPGSGDLVVPFPAKPDQPIGALNENPVYRLPDFLAIIRPLARMQLRAG